ncbi:hypothetical protein EMIHUDRAFT_97165 [Emiliania huxleyi CCMP1516]|uniref:Methyltransferase type 11 domain-containing protein n=2 Tax=Emiliania huxleyi TaxID=2903 RepID=A0A0D3I1V6_EMIH1|nr:hypothetical protein EMIHUDRAFT_97165 [Emiliania huxleyi CCMP1516]EOD05241.1 hypothetical protein EMIHUDRAFT_97165 [Emiliania huxleyi CCMP1516]|eukprot:XP_005757670.1 hypothetical protein EMIHUDRAFT_97165 [Emiliania huxleyi CCMP1516]
MASDSPPPRAACAPRATLLAAAVGLLSIAAASSLKSLLDQDDHTLRPQPGTKIPKAAFMVNVKWLERWARDAWRESGLERTDAAAAALAATFSRSKKLTPDADLARFLEASAATSASRRGRVLTRLKWAAFYALQLHLGWSRTDASGFLRLQTLYVASEEQFRALLEHAVLQAGLADAAAGAPARSLLDIGAGTGTETAKLAAALGVAPNGVTALESSWALRRALRARGFRAAAALDELRGAPPFTAAALLNVLDRCDEPLAVVDAAVAAVAPGGVLVLATVLPFSAKVFEGRIGGRNAARKPREPLEFTGGAWPAKAPAFEQGAVAFLDALVHRHPQLELASWTRLPYVSSGGVIKTHTYLDMALMAFRVKI